MADTHMLESENIPGGSEVKNLPANAGDTGLIPHATEGLSPCTTTHNS